MILRNGSARRSSIRLAAWCLSGFIGVALIVRTSLLLACPFCSATAPTIGSDLAESTAAVVAQSQSSFLDADGIRIYRLSIREVLHGDPALKGKTIEVTPYESLEEDSPLLLFGYGEDPIYWEKPQSISDEAIKYVRGLIDLPAEGAQRLEYFLPFLQHSDDAIAADAYNEFAESSMQEIAALSDQIDRAWVVAQLQDASVSPHRRRLCWTLLSFCGTKKDLHLVEQAIQRRSKDPTFDPGLDAAIACCLCLGGEDELHRIEREYLSNCNASYTDTFAAVGAIRVHGTDLDVVKRERLAESFRLLLARPALADLVIADLARWGDWSAIDRVVQLFETESENQRLVQSACVMYLKTCPLPKSQVALEKVRAMEPEVVKAAESSLLFYRGLPSVPVPPASVPKVAAPEAKERRQ
ncbi:MAG: hypothetical protein AAGJ83_09365 [Planctomycetota bacterium]